MGDEPTLHGKTGWAHRAAHAPATTWGFLADDGARVPCNGHDNDKLLRLPIIRQLTEAAPRSGFFEREPYEAVRRRLPDDLEVAVTIAHTYG